MRKVFIHDSETFCPLGKTSAEVYEQVMAGQTSLKWMDDKSLSHGGAMVSRYDDVKLNELRKTHQLFDYQITQVMDALLAKTDLAIQSEKTLVILCSTKGNIDALATNEDVFFPTTTYLEKKYNLAQDILVVSNACVSGGSGLLVASRLIAQDTFDDVIVIGADLVSHFVLTGFDSFMALSAEPCKPFDKNRVGLNVGEGASAVWLSAKPSTIRLDQVASTNDANHISGPHREGEGVFQAIQQLEAANIDFICAHGTATLYNDEMEAKAISRSGFNKVPTISLKGLIGHTMGASVNIELAILLEAFKHDAFPQSQGFQIGGTTEEINIIQTNYKQQEVKQVLKLASGFGGTNTAFLLKKC